MKEGGDADAHATKLEFRIGERVTFHPDWRPPVLGMITRGNLMYIDFSSIHNHHEKAVFEHVMELAPRYPSLNADLLVDAACIALNKLKAHYIRHDLDLNFY